MYLKGDQIGTTEPALVPRADCPLELTAAAVSSSVVQVVYQYQNAVNIYYRKTSERWWTHVATINASPFYVTGLAESTDYEFMVSINDIVRSNFYRVRTKQSSEAAPLRAAPSALAGSPDAANPQTQINLSWSRNATDNAAVEVWINGGYVGDIAGGDTMRWHTGLSAATTFSYKVRNKWSANDVSAFSNEISVSTAAAPPPPNQVLAPEITNGYYDDYNRRSVISFVPRGGTGNFSVDYRLNNGAWQRVYTDSVAANATSFTHPVFQLRNSERLVAYRIKREPSLEFSNPFEIVVPQEDYQCFVDGTLIWSAAWWRYLIFFLMMRIFGRLFFTELFKTRIEKIKVNDFVFSPDGSGLMHRRRVVEKFEKSVDEYLSVTFDDGSTVRVTGEHPFRVSDEGFERIKNLPVGAAVVARCPDGARTPKLIVGKEAVKLEQTVRVNNLHVDSEIYDEQTYIAADCEVHNRKIDPA